MSSAIESIAGDQPRAAAFLALLSSMREDSFIAESLEQWRVASRPSRVDLALAREIASGACRMAIQLDFLLDAAAGRKLTLKLKGRAILRCGAYQLLYLDRIPAHAAADESVALANQFGHRSFGQLVNALLRRIAESPPPLPTGSTPQAISIRTSFPLLFVDLLLAQFGTEQTEHLLNQLNQPPPTMARIRDAAPVPAGSFHKMAILPKGEITPSPDFIVQNITPVELLTKALHGWEGNRILDLCAAPGGKSVLLHDLFPDADLWVNEPSPKRVVRLRENLDLYRVKAHLTEFPGELYPEGERFDLIVIDAPCSNSGVLHKRPEARWRLTKEALGSLAALQRALIERAEKLLSPGGRICYLTCSILDCENREVVEGAGRQILFSEQVLPSSDGRDGGFAALLGESL